MKIDLQTASLFTDSGRFLKKLHCPLGMSWDTMIGAGGNFRTCDACSRDVCDTSKLNDDELLLLLSRDPHACLMISPTQDNCTVIPKMRGFKTEVQRQ
jgi:hypothetical protein